MKKTTYAILAILILALIAFGWYMVKEKQPSTNQNVNNNTNQLTIEEEEPIPDPNCLIEGTIKNVEYKEAWKHPCLDPAAGNPFACPADVSLGEEAQYLLTVDVSTSGCSDLIPQESTQNISIAQVLVPKDTQFNNNQKIKGEVKTRGKHYFVSYTLDE